MNIDPTTLPDDINLSIYEHMDMNQRKGLSLQTQMEMARGALGRSVNKEEALKYVNELGILADGERKLRSVLTKEYQLHVFRDRSARGDNGLVKVALGKKDGETKDLLFFDEQLEGFPTDVLLAKVMLVAG